MPFLSLPQLIFGDLNCVSNCFLNELRIRMASSPPDLFDGDDDLEGVSGVSIHLHGVTEALWYSD